MNDYTHIYGLWLGVWMNDQGLGRDMIRILLTKGSRKEACGQISGNEQKS
jgi:hypothetical protein